MLPENLRELTVLVRTSRYKLIIVKLKWSADGHKRAEPEAPSFGLASREPIVTMTMHTVRPNTARSGSATVLMEVRYKGVRSASRAVSLSAGHWRRL